MRSDAELPGHGAGDRGAPLREPTAAGRRHERPRLRMVLTAASVAAWVVVIAVAARWSVALPGAAVPQSGQTLAVVLCGGVTGPLVGPLTLLVYVGAGAAGLPVLAAGAAGFEAVRGSSAGYLAGFVVAAWMVGWLTRRRTTALPLLVAALAGHASILFLGWARLVPLVGARVAFESGVAPFLWGGVVKSLVAVVLLLIFLPWRRRGDDSASRPERTPVG